MAINKRGYEFGFSWFFTIVVGGVILFLSVYFAIRFIDLGGGERNTFAGKEIGVLLNPLGTGIESSKFSTLTVPSKSVLVNDCSSSGEFGTQGISVDVDSNLRKNGGPGPGEISSFKDRYLFSEKEVYGEKEFYVFSKPFYFPFKVTDLTILWGDSEKYCFIFGSDAGDSLERSFKDDVERMVNAEGENLLKNIETVSKKEDCSIGSKSVCFEGECDIRVDTRYGIVRKEGKTLNYLESVGDSEEHSMALAAVFSDPDVYECQTRRIIKKTALLTELYRRKNSLSPGGGCGGPRMTGFLSGFESSLKRDPENPDYGSLIVQAKDLDSENSKLSRGGGCALF